MKKIGKLFLSIFLILLVPIFTANAASKCSYEEQVSINNAAANIKATYEEMQGILDNTGVDTDEDGQIYESKYYYFRITIYNLSEDLFVTIKNDYNSEVRTFTYANSESGVVTYDWENLDKVTNFTITVYSSNKTSCPNEEYRIIYLTTPRYNTFSNYEKCNGNESFYLCQKFTLENEFDAETFMSKLESFKGKDKEEEKTAVEKSNSFLDFVKKNKLAIEIVATIIVVGGVVTTVVVIKKRRSRLI